MQRLASPLPVPAASHALMARPEPGGEFAALVEALADPRCYPHPVARVERIETHISVVLLAGDYAYKLKKPVRLPFLDFTDAAARARYCGEEVRLNRRTAPEIYLGVVPIAGPRWAPRVGGRGAPLERAVRMRRFPQEALASCIARGGAFPGALAESLAERVAAFHGEAERVAAAGDLGTAARATAAALDNFREMAGMGVEDAHGELHELDAWTRREGGRVAALLARRRSDGFVRECHGDLHLANIAVLGGVPMPFDAIEFAPAWRWIDVMSDVAFAAMDLAAHGCDRAAARFVNRYVETTGDHAGLEVLPFFEVYRAMVRAKVAAIRARQPGLAAHARLEAHAESRSYVALARRLGRPGPRALVLMHGFSGSGKTVASTRLVEALRAVRLRSDVERKRLLGVAERSRTGSPVAGGAYTPGATAGTYGRLLALARGVIEAGRPVIVDATFLARRDRAAFRGLAEALGASFDIVACEAPEATLRERVAARAHAGADASEANLAVLEAQLRNAEPLTVGERALATRVDTTTDHGCTRALEALAMHLRGGAR